MSGSLYFLIAWFVFAPLMAGYVYKSTENKMYKTSNMK